MDLHIPQKYRQDIDDARMFLKSEGCQSVYLFGSLVTGNIHDRSDIDIGIKGLPAKKFFGVYARLDKKLVNRVDLIDFDLNNDMFTLLSSLGEIVELE
jgi:predicted nucleotidyltransferase